MGKLIPVILALVGLGGGIGAGLMLRPNSDAAADHGAEASADHGDAQGSEEGAGHGEEVAAASACPPGGSVSGHDLPAVDGHSETEFVKINNQFVIPVIGEEQVTSMVVLTLSVEVVAGNKDPIFEREPKIRDAFLRVLFDHANAGGFDGNFINSAGLDTLRRALHEAAVKAVGPVVVDVLIVDLVRQDV